MKRTDFKKHAAALLLVLCLVVCCALPAFATSANIGGLGRQWATHVRYAVRHPQR